MPKIEPIPIILLTGFLGAGKTTLLAHWIKAPEFDGAMVIVNELGEVGLDHQLLTTSIDVPVLLDNGCACCAAQEDLVATLERLFWDRLHRRIPRYRWVLVETTGIADPKPIIAALYRHTLLKERYRVAAVVTALDATTGLSRCQDFPECRSQLRCADAVVITKSDIADAGAVERLHQELATAAPRAQVLRSAQADLAAGSLLAALPAVADDGARTDADHHHLADADVHAAHADGVTSAFLPLPGPLPWPALISALDTLLEGHGTTLLRLKGMVRLAGAPGYHAVQATPGQGITRQEIPIEPGDEPPRLGFTVIATQAPAASIASSFQALIAIRAARLPAAGGPVAQPPTPLR